MNTTDYLAAEARAMLEDELQNLIISPSPKCPGLARQLGYLCYHTHDSRRSEAGFPDLVLVGRRLIFSELKREGKDPTPAQQDWLNRLDGFERHTGGLVVARCWRPSDWFSGEIEGVLRG